MDNGARANALIALSMERGYDARHEARLALYEEALGAARALDPADPARVPLLYRVLDHRQRELYLLGRRSEGLATRAEMAAVRPAPRGLRTWAAGLADAGRYAEAADVLTEWVAELWEEGAESGALAWALLDRIAALDAAGRPGEALAACAELVGLEVERSADSRGAMACHLHALILHAHMLDARGRDSEATGVRREACALLTEIAALGERRAFSTYQSAYWAVVLALTCEDAEAPAGMTHKSWVPGTMRRYADGIDALRERAGAATDPSTRVRAHRVLTVRSAVREEDRTHLFAERIRPLFDEGVRLARRTGDYRLLARALTDRAAFRAAAKEFAAALADFREVMTVTGASTA
ncbi:hypothetical protein [Streptomyces sp. NPDC048172]|uniref:hypothetical protein n=1 Tax=Streptomyces sp. NPDC048172 TaxID=3365505 RepID=UPI00371142EA